MAATQILQAFSGVMGQEAITAGTSAIQVFNSTTTTDLRYPNPCQGVYITNNHATNDLFVGFEATTSTSNYTFKVAAGGTLPINVAGVAPTFLQQIYIIASGATTTTTLTVFI